MDTTRDLSTVHSGFDGEADYTLLSPGHMLGGKYKVISVLGKGGMGVVYKVQQVFLQKELALKLLDSRRVSDESQVRRFQLEAKAAYSLNHPNLVKVHDFGLLDSGQPYLVMDLIDGQSLSEYIQQTGLMNESMGREIFAQACRGLDYAHEQKVIHRDIKPSNIMILSGAGPGVPACVKIVDFGIAKIASHEKGEIQALTQTGEIFGSPLYMSPEQCSGAFIDHRTDIYSLGCTLFEALTGTPPHLGGNALRTMMLHQSAVAPLLREASLGNKFAEDLESIVRKMLEKAPQDRYSDMSLVADALSGNTSRAVAGRGKSKSSNLSSPQVTLGLNMLVCILLLTSALSAVCTFCAFKVLEGDRTKLAAKLNERAAGREKDIPSRADISPALLLDPDIDQDIKNKFGADRVMAKLCFEGIKGISSKIVLVNGIQKRRFEFPGFPIGLLTAKSGYLAEAGRTVDAPTGLDLRLSVGGDYPDAFEMPSVLSKIGTAEFTGLSIKAPTRNFHNAHINAAMCTRRLAQILTIAATWSKLDSIIVDSIAINERALEELDKCKTLTWIGLFNMPAVTVDLAKHPAFSRTQGLCLIKPTDSLSLVNACRGSQNLAFIRFVESPIDSRVITTLGTCPKLELLQFTKMTFTDDLLIQLGQLKPLREIDFNDAKLTIGQIKLVLKSVPQVTKIKLIGSSAKMAEVGNIHDPRLFLLKSSNDSD